MQNTAIKVTNMSKDFKIYFDKANSLKEKMFFWTRNKNEIRHVLKDVDLTINKGETVALIGTNGSGKSTLLKLMTKIIYPTKGKIKTYGNLTSLLELGAGFHQDFSGRENIYFNASIFGLTHKQIDERIEEIIKFSELEEFIDNPVRTYSSGMYMRLAFSVAINVDADILLIDEILAVGDQHFQEKCFNKLHELKKQNKTIVIVTHDLAKVEELCDRAVWIYNGEVKMDDKPSTVISKYLKQISMDHKNKKMKQEEKKEYKGLINIDEPTDFSCIEENEMLEIKGWQFSDCANSKLEIKVNDKLVKNIKRSPRIDVLQAYSDAYTIVNEDKVGFSVEVDTKKYVKEKEIKINASLYDENEKLLASKKVILYMDRK